MSAVIPLRDDFYGPALRALAKASKDANQTRRLLSLAVIYEGGRRSEAAVLGGVGIQIIRDWVLPFNAEGPEGLIDRKPPGASAKLNDAQRRALSEIVESGPIPAIHGVVRWRSSQPPSRQAPKPISAPWSAIGSFASLARLARLPFQ